MAIPTGDIYINGNPYRVDLRTYRKRDMVDFSPRAQTPSGSIIMSELGLYQPVLQDDWRHGFGFHWHEDAAGYLKTEGYVETGMEGIVMLYTQPVQTESLTTSKLGFTTFNSKVWSWGTSGLRSYTTAGGWVNEYNTGPVNYALATKDYLFYCPDGARIRKVDTSGTHSDAGNDSNSSDFKWLIIHNGYIYAGKDGTNYVHRDNTEDLSDLEGVTTDTNAIICGGGGLATIGAVEYAGKLYISRSDGLWVLGEDNTCRRVIDLRGEISSNNFRSMAVHAGYLVYPVRDQLYQWNGARVSNITPPKVTDTFPYTTYGRFDNFVVLGEYLYCTARTNDSTYKESLLRFDGTSWTRLADIITAGTDTVSGMGYDSVNNRLWFHEFRTGGGGYSEYIQFQDYSAYPYANFQTSGDHRLYTSRLHMGFKMVYKSSPSLIVEASNLSATQYIKVYYSIDGGAWTAWGGIDGTSNVINSTGVTELLDPLGSDNSTIEYYYLQLRFDFVTATATSSPILEAYTLRFLMRPDVFYGWGMDIVVEENYLYGAKEDGRTVKEMLDALEEARDSKAPIVFVDVFGTTHYGYLTAITEEAQERYDEHLGKDTNIAFVATVNITQVG